MDMNMMPTSKPAMKFTIGRCADSWIIKTKAPPPSRDYEEDEKNAAEALLMLAASGGGLFRLSSSSSASPTTNKASATKKPIFQLSPPSARNSSHTCNVCGKTFASHQALGGHKTSHRPKPAATEDVSAKNSSGRHKCAVCHEVFLTGQALGGHKRKHVDEITAGATAKRRPETSTGSSGDRDFNLNLPPLEFFSLRHSDLSSYAQL